MFFLELSCFFHDPADVGSLISGSSAFSQSSLNVREFTVHVLLKPGLENFEHYFTNVWDECNCAVVWAFFGISFLFLVWWESSCRTGLEFYQMLFLRLWKDHEFHPLFCHYRACMLSLSRVCFFETAWTGPTRLLCPWNFTGKDTGVGCHFLLQGIVPNQGSNLRLSLLHWQVDSLPLRYLPSPSVNALH